MSNPRKDGSPTVLVIMASYNGEKYIAEQIESILSQEAVDVTLRICDDGSIDSTPAICEAFASKYANVYFEINKTNKGLAKNFMDMVYDDASQGYDFYAFSDQDDVWLPEKLIHAVREIESRAASNEPALYYSDIENVGRDLSGGFREYASWSGCSHELVAVLTVNWASGCTMVFNPAMRSRILAYEPSSYARNHDGWVHLVAMVSGTVIDDLDNSYIKRRISGENQVGQRDLEITESLGGIARRWTHVFKKSMHCQTQVAECLLEGYAKVMNKDDARLVETYASMPRSFHARIKVASTLIACPFPTKSMAFSMACKAIFNRL
ncbi:glycosyltransferase [Paratractidigestivibacter sp.]|uniref:glycosyltransferase n=1 Tax=Paratractidigestivibacter sp. TaxID=2847316 RepID=UPI002ACB0EBD|nr:glycosyltransferase [Paratractidigestivibacter sp.]